MVKKRKISKIKKLKSVNLRGKKSKGSLTKKGKTLDAAENAAFTDASTFDHQ